MSHKKIMKNETNVRAERKSPGRTVVVSAPGATLVVERLNLTKDEIRSLSVNRRLSDIDLNGLKRAA